MTADATTMSSGVGACVSDAAPFVPNRKRKYERPTLVCYGSVKQLTNAVTNAGFDGFGRMMMSERACKENVVRVGEHPMGFGLYLFDYKPEFRDAFGHGRQFGVMADEVERVCPEAVRRNRFGKMLVDYARVGVVKTRKDSSPP